MKSIKSTGNYSAGMRNPKHRSAGLGAIGIILVLMGLVAVITLFLRLGPHYMDWQTMQSVFTGLERQSVQEMSKSQIREAIGKAFRMNSLRDFDQRSLVTIEIEKESTILSVSYEQREHIVFNIDIVLAFEESFQYP
jgi:hypothetical protein